MTRYRGPRMYPRQAQLRRRPMSPIVASSTPAVAADVVSPILREWVENPDPPVQLAECLTTAAASGEPPTPSSTNTAARLGGGGHHV